MNMVSIYYLGLMRLWVWVVRLRAGNSFEWIYIEFWIYLYEGHDKE